MDIPIPAPGFLENQLILRTAGFLGGPKILYNGEVASKGEQRGTFVATNTKGTESVLRIRPSLFGFDPIPKVEIDGQEFTLAPSLHWFEIIWAIAPVLMIPIGGAFGGPVWADCSRSKSPDIPHRNEYDNEIYRFGLRFNISNCSFLNSCGSPK